MKRFYFLQYFCLAVTLSVFSQDDISPEAKEANFGNVLPMSPNAAALAMYADYPVSHYTGIPNISIPLYEIEVDGYKLPISLSYHSNGIKLAQEATWVGLGWTLNAGGAISRTIKCESDFTSGRHTNITHQNVTKGWYYDTDTLSYEIHPPGYMMDIVLFPNGLKKLTDKYFLQTTSNAYLTIDTEPDIFFYNLPHLSGKFIYNKPKTPVLFDRNHNLKIEWGWNGYGSFKVTDDDGIIYLFLNEEFTRITRPEMDNADYTNETSWLLTKIITRNGQEINFSYDTEPYIIAPEQWSKAKYNLMNPTIGNFSSKPWLFVDGFPTRSNKTEFKSLRLKK